MAKVIERDGFSRRINFDAPTVIQSDGSAEWQWFNPSYIANPFHGRDGWVHRRGNGPAVVFPNGSQQWWNRYGLIRDIIPGRRPRTRSVASAWMSGGRRRRGMPGT
jgi:hypothetical protein